ncbi:MAG: RNA polymerase sigma factor [Pseudomonadota bacterium]|nr:RNA polymerase sigma factor [Pseudomonadota bacterium]
MTVVTNPEPAGRGTTGPHLREVPGSDADADLVDRIGRGDRAAMKAFYDRHQAGLHRFIRIRIGDAFEASDILQETFLEVWRNAQRFRGASAPRTWLYGIARNKAVDRLRRSSRTTLRDLPDDTIPDEAPSPLAVIEAASDAERLRACIGKLTPAQQSAVRLTFFEDLSYPEAAEVEGVPVGTIKTRIHHAKKLLMHCLTRNEAV